MTAILVSVRNLAEAQLAVRCGVDIVDLKEPSAGSLGRVDQPVARQIAATLGNAARLSMAMGELNDWQPETYSEWPLGSFEFVKIGLAGMRERANWREIWHAWRESIPTPTAAVAVSYVDHHLAGAPSVHSVLEVALQSGVRYMLLDTFDKTTGRLTSYVSSQELASLCAQLTASEMTLAVAGRLTGEMLPALRAHGIPIVAVRGAACENGRDSRLSERKLRELVALMKRDAGPDRWFSERSMMMKD